MCSVYCITGELAADDICYIYPLDYVPFPNNTITSGRSLHRGWGHINVIAEGKLYAVPCHLGMRKLVVLVRVGAVRGAHMAQTGILYGGVGAEPWQCSLSNCGISVFFSLPWELIEALTGSSYETQRTWY